MHPRAEEFASRARERYGLDVDIREFPEGTKTAADAADAVGCEVGQIASSLVFDVGEDQVVVVTSGANRVSESKLASHFDVEPDAVTMADADDIRETLGWAIGGVPPLCHETDLPILFDETLTAYDTVWAAAGTPQAVFPISPDELLSLSGATPADVTE
ncbi:YbaK/EbsC family protein [Haloplanus sp. GCM10025708]|uniref:YbaK/EbsC family protein n=1 Tax=Haloferacaceae TaxID=1644056 RepID=UPI003612EF5B